MKKIIIVYLLFLTAIGCKQNNHDYSDVETIKFNFSETNPLYEDIFKETTIIPLETNENCLVSEITQMEVWDNKIFILDWKLNSLLVFNTQGKYLNRIGRIGKGPGEYIRPRYFFINKKEALVKVFDAPTKKLMCFDYGGILVKEIKLNNYLRAVGESKSGYWGFCPNKGNVNVDNEQKKYVKFITFTPDGEVSIYVEGEKSIDQLNFSNTYISSALDGGVSFVEPFLPNIYSLKDEKITVKYNIDYSGYFPTEQIIDKIEKMDRPLSSGERELMGTLGMKYSSMFFRFYENDDWVLLLTGFKEGTTLIYNKNNKKAFEFSKQFYLNNSWETYFPMCSALIGNAVYGQADYRTIKLLLEENENISNKRRESLNKLLQGMSNDDNPLVIKYVIND